MGNRLERDIMVDDLDSAYDFVIAPDDYEFTTAATQLTQMGGDLLGDFNSGTIAGTEYTLMDGSFIGTIGWDDDDSWCRTAFAVRLEHIGDKGERTRFKLGDKEGIYDLGSPEGDNVFRMFVKTLSGKMNEGEPYQPGIWNSDLIFEGTSGISGGETIPRPDRVTMEVIQLNIPYFAALEAKILSEDPNPARLARNPELLTAKVTEIIDEELLYSLRLSKTVQTDENGNATWEFTIPDDWPPGPIFVVANYGYASEMEKSEQETDMENFDTIATLIQVGCEIALALLCPPCAPFMLAYFLTVEVWEIAELFAKTPLGGTNRHGCAFSTETRTRMTYMINYKGDENKIYQDMDAGQQQFMAQLLKDEETNKRNSMMTLGFMGATILVLSGFYAMFGGEDGR